MSDGSSNLLSDSVQDVTEEIFSRLTFPDFPFEFVISKEETWEGIWIYRIYHPMGKLHKSISERDFNRLRYRMISAADAFNGNDHLYAKIKLNDLVKEWEFHWGDEVKNFKRG
jgi:hypothetical protein